MQNKMCKEGNPLCRGCITPSDHEERQDNFFGGVVFTIIASVIIAVIVIRWVKVDKMMNEYTDTPCYSLINMDGSVEQICDGQS